MTLRPSLTVRLLLLLLLLFATTACTSTTAPPPGTVRQYVLASVVDTETGADVTQAFEGVVTVRPPHLAAFVLQERTGSAPVTIALSGTWRREGNWYYIDPLEPPLIRQIRLLHDDTAKILRFSTSSFVATFRQLSGDA